MNALHFDFAERSKMYRAGKALSDNPSTLNEGTEDMLQLNED